MLLKMIVSKECLRIVSLTKPAVTSTAARDFCWQIDVIAEGESSQEFLPHAWVLNADILLFNDKLCDDLATD